SGEQQAKKVLKKKTTSQKTAGRKPAAKTTPAEPGKKKQVRPTEPKKRPVQKDTNGKPVKKAASAKKVKESTSQNKSKKVTTQQGRKKAATKPKPEQGKKQTKKPTAKPPCRLFRILEYESTFLDTAVAMTVEECGLKVHPGTKVLVKPNLVSSKNPLACTHPNVTLSLCRYLKDCGAQVTVADSPGYGSAAHVSKAIGMTDGLKKMGLKPKSLGRPTALKLSFGETIG
ncbi:DUF362 domain-containing protein, partial [Aduncisulcus paluster]